MLGCEYVKSCVADWHQSVVFPQYFAYLNNSGFGCFAHGLVEVSGRLPIIAKDKTDISKQIWFKKTIIQTILK